MSIAFDLTSGASRQRRPTTGNTFKPGRVMLRVLIIVATLIAAVYVWRSLRERQAKRRTNQ